MSKDASPVSANQTGADVTGSKACGRTCIFAVGVGGIVGFGVSRLNLVVLAHGWALGNYFDVIDSPVISVTERAYRFFFASYAYNPETQRAILFYWTLIGLILGWIFCLARAGVIKDMACERICRYALVAGTCAGMFIGSFGFLAATNGWEGPMNFFESFDRPLDAVTETLRDRFHILDSVPRGSTTEVIYWNSAAIVYWTAIGLLVASLFCVIRIGKNRKLRARQ